MPSQPVFSLALVLVALLCYVTLLCPIACASRHCAVQVLGSQEWLVVSAISALKDDNACCLSQILPVFFCILFPAGAWLHGHPFFVFRALFVA
jgi:hypothetical protein